MASTTLSFMEHFEPGPASGEDEASAAQQEHKSRFVARKHYEEALRSVRDALRAASLGDLTIRLPPSGDGLLFNEVAVSFNTLVERQEALVLEIERMARVAGREGKLTEEASIGAADGAFARAVAALNELVLTLGYPITEATRVIKLLAKGELSHEMPMRLAGRPLQGDVREYATNLNLLTVHLQHLTLAVSHVVQEIGATGAFGPKAETNHLTGSFRAVIDEVNFLATSLTVQVRGIARVVTGVAAGDLSQKVDVTSKGELADLANTINDMIDRLRIFAKEVTTVAREVGIDGKLGGQAIVPGASGTWRDLTDSVNMLAGNLTTQVRNIALVISAISRGDLSQKITVEAKGEVLELKNTVNETVDQLGTLASEVLRVANEVGIEGKLGGQAIVPGAAGMWKDLADNTNMMARNLTDQVRGIARVVTAVAHGDLSQQFIIGARGEIAALADTINGMTDTLRTFADQVTTVAREVGIEGQLGGQARVPGAAGTWKDLTDNVNMLASNLTLQVRNIALVTTAVATGDLSRKITVEAKGEILELKDTINAMVVKLRTFASEVTRVAREVGIEGQLGGQAHVPGAAGTWRDLTDNVNVMASNLTEQVRTIGQVVTAVANGDLSRQLSFFAKGEIAELADTINGMTDTLRTFADQVTTVAREVGIDGKLGGQAKVPGAAGTWRGLTDNVNQLAANLTTQVRAIAEVAKAVTEGDLTRTITVEARGEVLALKDTINQMIENLAETTRTNEEQSWLKTNLAKLFGLMQGQRSLEALASSILSELAPMMNAQHGAFFLVDREGGEPVLKLLDSYAYVRRKGISNRFALGEGLVGQCALEKKPIIVTNVPDDYVQIGSGLGEAPPRCITLAPILFENQVRGVLELGSFHEITPIQLNLLEQIMFTVGQAINLIGTSMRTEELLQQLKGSNVELEQRRTELEDKAQLLEVRNREIADASASLRGQTEELSKVSRYKSQFLANMSHEIRTPLNSMMILAQMLSANEEGNLTDVQREWATTIQESGRDLLALINQILDLSKVEAGRIETNPEACSIRDIANFIESRFRPVALQSDLSLSIELSDDAPKQVTTDRRLLEQILKNLLSNAFKFTEHGGVRVRIGKAADSISFAEDSLAKARGVVQFSVTDTGIGIPEDKRELVFQAFQQADSSITRKYGGTGLGLTISREYARLLGGELVLESREKEGSTFTLYLPLTEEDLGLRSRDVEAEASAGMTAGPVEMEGKEKPPPQPSDFRELSGEKILVVEDDPRNLFAMTSFLERHDAIVVPATSAKEAYAHLKKNPDIGLVLMDLMMPEIDGYEATRTIRSTPKYRELPIIAFTAKATESDRNEALAAGCTDYLSKPPDTQKLLSILVRHLRERGSER